MCERCRSSGQMIRLPTMQLHGRDCCPPRTRMRRYCDRQTTRATTTSSCTHSHSQELVRTTSSACYELDACACNSPWLFSSPPQPNRIEVLLRELLDVYIEDDDACECTCERYHEHCTCEQDQNSTVCELMDLLDRVRLSERQGFGWRCRSPRDRGQGCCSDRDVQTETQTLFEVLFRITKRRTYRSSGPGASRGECAGGKGRDIGLSRVVKQLLDELESGGGCTCHSCHTYLEDNSRQVRKALREIEGDYGGRQEGCGCGFSSGTCCSGCVSTVTKVTCERPIRRSRNGNVHVGWSLG